MTSLTRSVYGYSQCAQTNLPVNTHTPLARAVNLFPFNQTGHIKSMKSPGKMGKRYLRLDEQINTAQMPDIWVLNPPQFSPPASTHTFAMLAETAYSHHSMPTPPVMLQIKLEITWSGTGNARGEKARNQQAT